MSEVTSVPVLSVIVPVYNEAENLPVLFERLKKVAADLRDCEVEFVFVDDGSSDESCIILQDLARRDLRVRAIQFSRNFGSHAACLAGLTEATGDFFIFLAADLQDPPELMAEMLEHALGGADVVLAVRSQRGDPWLTVQLANLYHKLMRRYAVSNWPATGADVMMLSRRVRDVVVNCRQRNTSLFAQVLWTGFRQVTVPYVRAKRHAGVSHWTLAKKLKLFADSFVSFSFSPIRLISYSGMLLSAGGFGYAAMIVLNKLFFSQPIAGWSSLMVVLLMVSGFQLLMLGVIGEYLWRVADEVRGTPPYVVHSIMGPSGWEGAGAHHIETRSRAGSRSR